MGRTEAECDDERNKTSSRIRPNSGTLVAHSNITVSECFRIPHLPHTWLGERTVDGAVQRWKCPLYQ